MRRYGVSADHDGYNVLDEFKHCFIRRITGAFNYEFKFDVWNRPNHLQA